MKVLIACEESQEVCKAFRELGHEAYSCDILPCSGGHPEWHIQCDVLIILNGGCIRTQDGIMHEIVKWDLLIGHPPCTYLTVTGARWLYADKNKDKPHPKFPERRKHQQEAVNFFIELWMAKIPKIALENPIGIMSTRFMKPSQIIKPCQFGHDANKKTCLWLKELPNLLPTKEVEVTFRKTKSGRIFDNWYWETSKLKGKERQMARSKTFQGIAKAMAEQWGGKI